ncbi:unnamed protein product [Enterobius vermicularis]|uniref:MFS domain-containing protein n=1 Tax=Enterobius vermicularis TaxID=51028 RepID=A0A158Q9D0_ENTVE|nr:unnamed protein product [Enterobius vermicularis]
MVDFCISLSSSISALFHLFSRRFHLLLLLLTGFCLTSFMRGNLGVTMTCMVNSTAVALKAIQDSVESNKTIAILNIPEQCRQEDTPKSGLNDYGGTIEWNVKRQKEMFKGTFWGSLITVLISGYIADRTSPKWLFQIAFTIYVVTTVVFPFLVNHVGFEAAFASRVLMGIGEGAVFPAITALIAKWYPAVERSTAASFSTAGNQLAGVLGSPFAAALCASAWQWPSVFYSCGEFQRIIGAIWSILWCFTVSDTPSMCKYMSPNERKYLQLCAAVKKSEIKEDVKIPWKAILTSFPVWSVLIGQLSTNFISVLMQSYIPTYYKEVLYMKLKDNGFYSSLPNIFLCGAKVLWGIAMDALRRKGICSPTATCKLSQWFSNITLTVVFLCLAFFVDCTRSTFGVVLMCGFGIGYSASVSGTFTSLLSLAPNFTGTISSLAMLFGIVGRLLAPDLVGLIRVYGTIKEWRLIYITLAVVSMICCIQFGIFGSAEIQPWATQASPKGAEQEKLLEEKLTPGKFSKEDENLKSISAEKSTEELVGEFVNGRRNEAY